MDREAQTIRIPILERRIKPRMPCDYFAIVKGKDKYGKKYEEIVKLINLSASGLYLQMNHFVDCGEKLLVTIELHNKFCVPDGQKLITCGIVVRTEPSLDGIVGVAIKFLRYKLS